MNILIEEHKALIVQLLEAKIDFILIGGYAVIYHGYGRTTGDMDIWLRPANENRAKLIPLLEAQGIIQDDIERLRKTDFTQMIAFHIDEPPYRVDFLTGMVGLKYDEADKKKVFFSLGQYQVPVLHLDHLIVNKLISGRAKDKADVEELQKIMQLKKRGGRIK